MPAIEIAISLNAAIIAAASGAPPAPDGMVIDRVADDYVIDRAGDNVQFR